MSSEAYEKGMATRLKVMGDKHVAKRQKSDDPFTRQQQQFVTEFAWGTIWSRPQLPLKTRSLITLAMITALNRPDELGGHIRGALNNGATKEEIMEVFHHASVYCGMPAANGSVRACVEVFRELGVL
jgi:4-carboxymuconolactone decarboxylase